MILKMLNLLLIKAFISPNKVTKNVWNDWDKKRDKVPI